MMGGTQWNSFGARCGSGTRDETKYEGDHAFGKAQIAGALRPASS